MLSQWPPLKLAKLGFAGACIFASQFMMTDLVWVIFRNHVHHFNPNTDRIERVAYVLFILPLFLSPMLIGALLIGLAKVRLFVGLNKKRWSEPDVERARLWIESPVLTKTGKSLIGIWLFVDVGVYYSMKYIWKIPIDSGGRVFFDSFLFLIFPYMIVLHLREALRLEPPDEYVSPKGGWAGTIQGIHSDHWGGRETPRTASPEA
ncbi:MAG: hypothetical protein ABR889_07200 [Acidobacteriaceae bacterium]|jgi:hypothetical protein